MVPANPAASSARTNSTGLGCVGSTRTVTSLFSKSTLISLIHAKVCNADRTRVGHETGQVIPGTCNTTALRLVAGVAGVAGSLLLAVRIPKT